MDHETPDLTLHAEFESVFGQCGGLLDIPADSELHLHIGRLCVGRDSHLLSENELTAVVAVQRMYDGTLAFRLKRSADDFGRPARPETVLWVSSEEPVFLLRYLDRFSGDVEQLRVPAFRLEEAKACLEKLCWPLQNVWPAPQVG